MAGPMSAGKAVKRLEEVIASVNAIAEREEGIAHNLRMKAERGDMPEEFRHRAFARAETLTRLAFDLRVAVGARVGSGW